MDKLMKYARITGKVLAVLRGLVIAGIALAAIGAGTGLGLSRQIADLAANSPGGQIVYHVGTIVLRLDPSALNLTPGNVVWLCLATLAMVAIIALMALRLIRLFSDMMADIGQGRPFSGAMTKKVRQTGVIVVIYAFVTPLISLIPMGFAIGSLQVPIGLTHIGYRYNVNTLALVAGLMVMLLSLVFDYGAQLQQQADETL